MIYLLSFLIGGCYGVIAGCTFYIIKMMKENA